MPTALIALKTNSHFYFLPFQISGPKWIARQGLYRLAFIAAQDIVRAANCFDVCYTKLKAK